MHLFFVMKKKTFSFTREPQWKEVKDSDVAGGPRVADPWPMRSDWLWSSSVASVPVLIETVFMSMELLNVGLKFLPKLTKRPK